MCIHYTYRVERCPCMRECEIEWVSEYVDRISMAYTMYIWN